MSILRSECCTLVLVLFIQNGIHFSHRNVSLITKVRFDPQSLKIVTVCFWTPDPACREVVDCTVVLRSGDGGNHSINCMAQLLHRLESATLCVLLDAYKKPEITWGEVRGVSRVGQQFHSCWFNKVRHKSGAVSWSTILLQHKVLLSPQFWSFASHGSSESAQDFQTFLTCDAQTLQDEFPVDQSIGIEKSNQHHFLTVPVKAGFLRVALTFLHPDRCGLFWCWVIRKEPTFVTCHKSLQDVDVFNQLVIELLGNPLAPCFLVGCEVVGNPAGRAFGQLQLVLQSMVHHPHRHTCFQGQFSQRLRLVCIQKKLNLTQHVGGQLGWVTRMFIIFDISFSSIELPTPCTHTKCDQIAAAFNPITCMNFTWTHWCSFKTLISKFSNSSQFQKTIQKASNSVQTQHTTFDQSTLLTHIAPWTNSPPQWTLTVNFVKTKQLSKMSATGNIHPC